MNSTGLGALDESAEMDGGNRIPPDPAGYREVREPEVMGEAGPVTEPGEQRSERRGRDRPHARSQPPVSADLEDFGTAGGEESNTIAERTAAAAARLREARMRAGYRSGSQFARQLKMNVFTYLRYERGVQPITLAIDKVFTRELRLDAGMILFGRRADSSVSQERQVPIVGIVRGPVGKVTKAMPLGMTSTVPAYVPDNLVSIIIDDDTLYPAYRAGDRVFFRALDREKFEAKSVHTLECVVELATGEHLVRQVFVQDNGLCTLNAYHGQTALDQKVVAAEPIEIVFRHTRR